MSSIIASIHDRHGLRKFKYADDFTSDALHLFFKNSYGSIKRDDLLKNQPLKKKQTLLCTDSSILLVLEFSVFVEYNPHACGSPHIQFLLQSSSRAPEQPIRIHEISHVTSRDAHVTTTSSGVLLSCYLPSGCLKQADKVGNCKTEFVKISVFVPLLAYSVCRRLVT